MTEIRITGGKFRGLKLETIHGFETRPAMGKIRQAICNILQNRMDGAVILDVFAGIGTIGIECLSRGAKFAVFVEKDARCCAVIRANLKALDLYDRAVVMKTGAFDMPEKLAPLEIAYDVIFLDPPFKFFENDESTQNVRALMQNLAPHMSRGALLMLRHTKHWKEDGLAGFARDSVHDYGDNILTFYSRV